MPSASTAAVTMFSVAPTLGNGSTMSAPCSRSARGVQLAVGELELGAHRLEGGDVHVDRAGAEVVAARASTGAPRRSG